MFGPPGTAYVYLVYGMHDCLNVAAGPAGEPSAILIRAVEPIEGVDRMRVARADRTLARRRAVSAPGVDERHRNRLRSIEDARLASGPGLVTAAFDVDRRLDGIDLLEPGAALRIEVGSLGPSEQVVSTPRIGIGYADEPWTIVPWRFVIAGHVSVSGPQPGTRPRGR